jgi:NAD dependent epimerase/dehydratase
LSDKRVLVTGADGFIGSHLVEALVKDGFDVRAFIYYNSFGSRGWLDHVPVAVTDEVDFRAGDIRDPASVRAAISGCDTVLHLAALIAIPYSYEAPASYVDTNITGTLNVLQAARDFDVRRVVHTSTSEVYGSAIRVPIDENHPLQAQSPYAATKIAADQLALSFHRSFGLPVSICRPFNTYGPRQSLRAVLPTIIRQVLGGRREIQLGALHPTRDFNFVKDTVRAFTVLAATDAAIGEVINFGSNYEISIGDAVGVIGDCIGAELEVTSSVDRMRPEASEVDRLWADNTKARELVGWTPDYAGLAGFARGISETIDWFREPQNVSTYRDRNHEI